MTWKHALALLLSCLAVQMTPSASAVDKLPVTNQASCVTCKIISAKYNPTRSSWAVAVSVISSCPYSLGVKVKLIGYDATSKEVCRYQLSNQPRFSSSKLSTNRISEMVDINIPTIERWEVLWETFDVVDNQPNTMPPEWVKKNVSVTVEPIKTSGKHTLKDGITVPLVLENRSDQSLDVYIKLIAVDKKNSIIYSKKGSMIRIEPYKTCKFDLGVAEKEDGLITASWRVELEVKTVVDTVERKYKTQQKRAG